MRFFFTHTLLPFLRSGAALFWISLMRRVEPPTCLCLDAVMLVCLRSFCRRADGDRGSDADDGCANVNMLLQLLPRPLFGWDEPSVFLPTSFVTLFITSHRSEFTNLISSRVNCYVSILSCQLLSV